MARVLALVPDLMLASRVEATLSAAGHDVSTVPSPEAIEAAGGDVAVVDLGEIEPSDVAGRGLAVIGFYSHVDVDTRRRAEEAGIDLVVPRSRMAREMPQLVESVVRERRAGRGRAGL